jgi:hypothetical protein
MMRQVESASLVRFARKSWPDKKVALKVTAATVGRIVERRLGYERPWEAPWRRRSLAILRPTGVGDVLMCTPALRELRRLCPECRVQFYTDLPLLVRGLPYIDDVMPAAAAPLGAVFPDYAGAVPCETHLSNVLASSLGVSIDDPRPDCVVDRDLVAHYREMWQRLPHPHIVVSRRASAWTPNKHWPDAYWQALIGRLSRRAGVVEIGQVAPVAEDFGPHYVDLRGRTSLERLVAVVAGADLHVGPPSGPVHIAAATGKRSVVIVGGYESPNNAAYPRDITLYTQVACAPCWLRTPCPHGLKCLHEIAPEEVEAAVLLLWSKIAGGELAAAQPAAS